MVFWDSSSTNNCSHSTKMPPQFQRRETKPVVSSPSFDKECTQDLVLYYRFNTPLYEIYCTVKRGTSQICNLNSINKPKQLHLYTKVMVLHGLTEQQISLTTELV
jgi:hypothetical protein